MRFLLLAGINLVDAFGYVGGRPSARTASRLEYRQGIGSCEGKVGGNLYIDWEVVYIIQFEDCHKRHGYRWSLEPSEMTAAYVSPQRKHTNP